MAYVPEIRFDILPVREQPDSFRFFGPIEDVEVVQRALEHWADVLSTVKGMPAEDIKAVRDRQALLAPPTAHAYEQAHEVMMSAVLTNEQLTLIRRNVGSAAVNAQDSNVFDAYYYTEASRALTRAWEASLAQEAA